MSPRTFASVVLFAVAGTAGVAHAQQGSSGGVSVVPAYSVTMKHGVLDPGGTATRAQLLEQVQLIQYDGIRNPTNTAPGALFSTGAGLAFSLVTGGIREQSLVIGRRQPEAPPEVQPAAQQP